MNECIKITTSLNDKVQYHWNSVYDLPADKFTRVNIKQKWDAKEFKYFYTITIDNTVALHVENNNPQLFDDVKVLHGDLWYEPAKAFIKNLKVTTSSENGDYSLFSFFLLSMFLFVFLLPASHLS